MTLADGIAHPTFGHVDHGDRRVVLGVSNRSTVAFELEFPALAGFRDIGRWRSFLRCRRGCSCQGWSVERKQKLARRAARQCEPRASTAACWRRRAEWQPGNDKFGRNKAVARKLSPSWTGCHRGMALKYCSPPSTTGRKQCPGFEQQGYIATSIGQGSSRENSFLTTA